MSTKTDRHKADQEPQVKLKRKRYEKEMQKLQVELCILQDWVKKNGERAIIIFEGRDAAGKGGTIKAITERVSPRVFRVVALPAPSDREKTQVYAQRYIAHFPAAGEVVIYDRSWYNRAGVEYVLGFCTDEEQERRFAARIEDPLRQWKLSPTDLESRRRWYDYSLARDMMFDATDSEWAPWNVVRSDDKKRARLNIISHLLSQFPYEPIEREKVKMPDRSNKKAYDDIATMKKRRWIREKY
jgi:polyphosphate kinase